MRGLGLDICSVERIEKAIQAHPSFLMRYYNESERAYIAQKGKVGGQSAAAMYAAKEAFLKAVGTGINGEIPLDAIGVSHSDTGEPSYTLGEKALQKMQAMGATQTWLTISHEAGVAVAVAILE